MKILSIIAIIVALLSGLSLTAFAQASPAGVVTRGKTALTGVKGAQVGKVKSKVDSVESTGAKVESKTSGSNSDGVESAHYR